MKMKRQDGECLGCDGEFDDIGFRRSHSGGPKSTGHSKYEHTNKFASVYRLSCNDIRSVSTKLVEPFTTARNET